MQKIRNGLVWMGVLLVSLWFSLPGVANAPPPPSLTWLKFHYESSTSLSLQGVQLVACDAIACHHPVLLMQDGRCKNGGCLQTQPLWHEGSDRLDCVGDTCLIAFETFRSFALGETRVDPLKKGLFRLIGQFSDRVRISPVTPWKQPSSFADQVWTVTVQDTDLLLAAGGVVPGTNHFQHFGTALLLTLPVEIAIAILWLLRLRANSTVISRTVITVCLAHLATIPLVWIAFPALEPFQVTFVRMLGMTGLLGAIAYALVLWSFRRRSSVLIVCTALLLWIGIVIIIGLTSLVLGYGSFIPLAGGLPYFITMPLSEVVVMGYEAFLLTSLSQGNLSSLQAVLMSILMNLTSLILGIWLPPTFERLVP